MVFSPVTVLEPDLLVVPVVTGSGRRIESIPLLVVEVLSPSTRRYDLHTKRVVYRDAGAPAYWIIDPGADDAPITLTEWRWDGDDETAHRWEGDEEATLEWPFPVTVVPARLVLPGG